MMEPRNLKKALLSLSTLIDLKLLTKFVSFFIPISSGQQYSFGIENGIKPKTDWFATYSSARLVQVIYFIFFHNEGGHHFKATFLIHQSIFCLRLKRA